MIAGFKRILLGVPAFARVARFLRAAARYAAMAPAAAKAGGWMGALCLVALAPYFARLEAAGRPARAQAAEREFHYALS